MCRALASLYGRSPRIDKNFSYALVEICQEEFDRSFMKNLSKEEYQSDMAAAESEDKRKRVQSEFEKRECKARARNLGFYRFIGELYNRNFFTDRIMYTCVNKLLFHKIGESSEEQENSLDCLCEFFITIGTKFDSKTSSSLGSNRWRDPMKPMSDYLLEMQYRVNATETSTKIKFRIQYLIDLWRRRWVQDENNHE